MTAVADDSDAVLVERSLMDTLFSQEGRSDPQAVLRTSSAPGCRYRFVQQALHDPRFVATTIPPSPDLMFQTVLSNLLEVGSQPMTAASPNSP